MEFKYSLTYKILRHCVLGQKKFYHFLKRLPITEYIKLLTPKIQTP